MLIAMRSHRRRLPVDHILIAGDAADLPCIRAALAILSADSYGQVYVRATADTPLDLPAPARMTVHRIEGSLEEAVDSWVAEWMPCEQDPKRRVTVWVGSHARPEIATAYAELEGLVDQL